MGRHHQPVLWEIGKVPYINNKIEATNVYALHRTVYVRRIGRQYLVECEGYSTGELPPATPDFDKMLRAAKRFIGRNRGSSRKRPLLCSAATYQPGRKLVVVQPVVRSRRDGERRQRTQ